jgi:hypothetical protein
MTRKPNFDRMMNLLVVTVVEKKFIFFNKKHEIYILYTPTKKRIHKMNTLGYKKFPFSIGDNAKDVITWCDDNGHEYRKRRGKQNHNF